MSNEKRRADCSWQTRLDQLEEVPGSDGTWKEAAWDKLYDRLHVREEKPRKKRVVWYWVAAAACMAPLFFLWQGRLRPDGPGHTMTAGTGSIHGPVAAAADSAEVKATALPSTAATGSSGVDWSSGGREGQAAGGSAAAVVQAAPLPGGRSWTSPTSPTTLRSSASPTSSESLKSPVSPTSLRSGVMKAADTMEAVVVNGPEIHPATTPAPLPLLASAAVVKPKLRVVYLNELGAPVKEDRFTGHWAGVRSFPFQLPFNDPSRPLPVGMEATSVMADSGSESSPLFKISLKN